VPVGRPIPGSTNTWRLDTRIISTGLAATPSSGVVFSEGRDANRAIETCEVWLGALCGPKLFWRLPPQKALVRHSFVLRANYWSLDHNLIKRTWIFTTFLETSASTTKKNMIALKLPKRTR
jgi:hypothetical protein